MGTTLTAVVLRGSEVFLAHVGDSRAYLVRAGAAVVLTADHSLVAQLVRAGLLTPAEARVDPRRNMVTRSVGVAPEVEADVVQVEEPPRTGDTLLLTTDGLHGLLSDEEIGTVASDPDLDAVCGRLVALARQRGGPDNITVVAARLAG
jgi:serine/threonine protein phosphatase PrpC